MVACALAAAAGLTVPAILTGALGPILGTELGLTRSDLGGLVAIFFAIGGIGGTLGGQLVDRIGWKRSIRIASAVNVAGLVAIGAFARSRLSLAVFLAVCGLAFAIGAPAGSLAIAKEVPVHRQGFLLGIKQSAIPVAGIFSGAALPVVALSIGWPWAYVIAALFSIVAWIIAPSESPTPAKVRNNKPKPVPPQFSLMAFGGGLATLSVGAFAAFATVSAVDAGISESGAGVLASLGSIAGLMTRVASGWIADRTNSLGFHTTAVMLTVGALGFGLMAVGAPLPTVLGILVAYSAGWGWAPLFQYGAVIHHPDGPAAAVGRLQTGLATGTAVGPLIFGFIADQFGLRMAWMLAMAVVLVGAAVIRVAAIRLPAPS